jgi:hypothetical protein
MPTRLVAAVIAGRMGRTAAVTAALTVAGRGTRRGAGHQQERRDGQACDPAGSSKQTSMIDGDMH